MRGIFHIYAIKSFLACCNCFVYDVKQVSVFEDLVIVATVMNSSVSITLSQMLLSEAWKHGKK